MIAEVISIGDELTSGQRLDTNSQWLSQRLGDLGVRVLYHTTVADDLAANVAVFRHAIQRADIVVATGGLGPTADDLTREALAQAAGVEFVLDEPSLEHIRKIFARFRREMPEQNIVQAMFPAGSKPIPNPHGTAPGIDMQFAHAGHACRVFALPGVPAEMFEMFDASVAPAIVQPGSGARTIRHRRIKCFGVGESHLEAMLPGLIVRGRDPAVGITVHEATITLRVTAGGADAQECFRKMEPTVATIYGALGKLIFGEEDDELQDAVVRLLEPTGRTLSTIEAGTDGLLSHWLCEASHGSHCYRGGMIVRDTGVAMHEPATSGESAAAVSQAGKNLAGSEAVERIARACRERYQTDYALAVGPFPASDGASVVGPPETYYVALASAADPIVRASTLAGHPSLWKPRAAKQGLDMLRLALLDVKHAP